MYTYILALRLFSLHGETQCCSAVCLHDGLMLCITHRMCSWTGLGPNWDLVYHP